MLLIKDLLFVKEKLTGNIALCPFILLSSELLSNVQILVYQQFLGHLVIFQLTNVEKRSHCIKVSRVFFFVSILRKDAVMNAVKSIQIQVFDSGNKICLSILNIKINIIPQIVMMSEPPFNILDVQLEKSQMP